MTPKQKIDEILKREGVREFFVRKPRAGFCHDFITNISGSSQWGDNEVRLTEYAYVQKLEKLVLELGEMSEALVKINAGSFVGCARADARMIVAKDALTRLNNLLDEMGGEMKNKPNKVLTSAQARELKWFCNNVVGTRQEYYKVLDMAEEYKRKFDRLNETAESILRWCKKNDINMVGEETPHPRDNAREDNRMVDQSKIKDIGD